MRSINHERARSYLHRGAKELNASEATALETHLSACTRCRTYADALGELKENLEAAFHARWDGIQSPKIHAGELLTHLRRGTTTIRISNLTKTISGVIGLALLVVFLNILFFYLRPQLIEATPHPSTTETALWVWTSTPTSTYTPIPPPQETTIPTPTPEASPTPAPRTLTICLGAQPDSLYIYDSSMHVTSNVLEAIYDGPIDSRGFDYQPIILEKLPSLADGDATIQPVSVQAGYRVVNDDGEVVQLTIGEKVRPYSCRDSSCAIVWDGEPLEMSQLSARYTLLEGLRWSDGEPLTASDSVYSFGLAAESGLGTYKYNIERTATYTAIDERSLLWVGLPGFLNPSYRTNFVHPLPEHQLEGHTPEELLEAPETNRTPMGWGPYAIEKWQEDEFIRLRRNPYYFRSAEGLPYFDILIFRFLPNLDPDQNLADLLAGECDLLDLEATLYTSWDYLLELDASDQVQAHFTTIPAWEHADFNIRPVEEIVNTGAFAGWDLDGDGLGPFGDTRLRQAIALCLDRQTIVETIYYGQSQGLASYIPFEHPLFNSNVTRYPFDPASAAALLDETGWKDEDGDGIREAHDVSGVPEDTPLEFNYETTDAAHRQQAGQILVQSLTQCGIRVNLTYYPASEWFADGPDGKLFGRKFDMGEFGWIAGSRPVCDLYMTEEIPGPPEAIDPTGNPLYPRGWNGQNETGYSNPEFDTTCQAALQALPDEPEYFEYHQLAQEIFVKDLPVIPLYSRIWVTAARTDMCGHAMDASAYSDFWNIEEYDYGDGCR